MKPNIIKAVVAMEKFFTYNVDPEEFVSLINRIEPKNERDSSMLQSLCASLEKSMSAGIIISK